jgi:hypothetical protein
MSAAVGALLVLNGCGGSSSSTSVAASSASTATTSSTQASSTHTAVGAPGCGQFCQEAGASAGQATWGYPCPKPRHGQFTGCRKCPNNECMTLFDRRAAVTAGVFTVRVRCDLKHEPCIGAFLACDPNKFCFGNKRPGPQPSYGGRLAGSDFKVADGNTAAIEVGVTKLGKRLVATPHGYQASVLISLKNHGMVTPTTPAGGNPAVVFIGLTSHGTG